MVSLGCGLPCASPPHAPGNLYGHLPSNAGPCAGISALHPFSQPPHAPSDWDSTPSPHPRTESCLDVYGMTTPGCRVTRPSVHPHRGPTSQPLRPEEWRGRLAEPPVFEVQMTLSYTTHG